MNGPAVFNAIVSGSRVSLSLVTALLMLGGPFIVVGPSFPVRVKLGTTVLCSCLGPLGGGIQCRHPS